VLNAAERLRSPSGSARLGLGNEQLVFAAVVPVRILRVVRRSEP
jgi:hypothetical protein